MSVTLAAYVLINSQTIQFNDVQPTVRDGVAFVPLRPIIEKIEGDIIYDHASNYVKVIWQDRTLAFHVGTWSNIRDFDFFVDGQHKHFRSYPGMELLPTGQQILVFPVRALSEAFDIPMTWDEKTKTVSLTVKLTNKE